jgi:hypothetical protein
MTDESELDTDGDSEYQGGETDDGDDSDSAREVDLDDDDEPDSVVPDVNEDGVDKKRKYRSKQREMHRALDGSALLAIGEFDARWANQRLRQVSCSKSIFWRSCIRRDISPSLKWAGLLAL